MIVPGRLGILAAFCVLLTTVESTNGNEPPVPGSKSIVERNPMKIPITIEGTLSGGELVELRVHDRIAFVIRPTGKVDLQKR